MLSPLSRLVFSRVRLGFCLLVAFLLTEAIALGPAFSAGAAKQTKTEQGTSASARGSTIPAGTILPVVLGTSISFEKCKPGQALRGKIAQDVPLPNGTKIQRGAAVEGHIADVTPGANGSDSKVAIQFDKVYMAGQWVHVVTNLRAIAGFVAIQQASVPTEAPAEGSPYEWLPTSQIGGDTVYGRGGQVISDSKVVGRSVNGGVLVQVSENQSTGCRGEINGSPQALWVFSADACGVYGIEHLKIDHAGRSDPQGTIVLASETPKLKLSEGDGLLLRVN
jgi:hypothetical protein